MTARWASRRRLLALGVVVGVAALLVYVLAPGRNGPQPGSLGAFAAHLDTELPHLMYRHAVPGVAVALVRGGEVVWTGAYGFADPMLGVPLTTDTPFMLHSVSKSVTAWGVMRLVEAGVIDLDEPVAPHLAGSRFPVVAEALDGVTFRRLLSNSAGMPLGPIAVHYAPDAVPPPLDEYLAAYASSLQSPPGSEFRYSNLGYALLEILIENVSSVDFGAFMSREVLLPLGMTGASFDWSAQWSPPVGVGHDLRGRQVHVYRYTDRAAGGLYASVDDVARFAAAGAAGGTAPDGTRVLSEASVDEIFSGVIDIAGIYRFVADGYGLGHFLERLQGGATGVFGGGQGLGWMTHVQLAPASGDGIVVLTNSQRSWQLIASLLNDWARWSGVGTVGMGAILLGARLLTVVVGLLMTAAVWQAARLAIVLVAGRGQAAQTSRVPASSWALGRFTPRLVGFAIAATAGGLLVWAALQDYLFLPSLYPDLSVWLGHALGAVALTFLAASLVTPAGSLRRSP